ERPGAGGDRRAPGVPGSRRGARAPRGGSGPRPALPRGAGRPVSAGPRRLPLTVAGVARREGRDPPGAPASVDCGPEGVVGGDAATADRTAEVARSFGSPDRPVRVIERPWAGHVAQKSFALEAAAWPWVLCLDADERVGDDLRAELEAVFQREPS